MACKHAHVKQAFKAGRHSQLSGSLGAAVTAAKAEATAQAAVLEAVEAAVTDATWQHTAAW